jgi:hypothetical protein
MENQHLVLWRGPCSTQRQAWELTSGPDLATRARLLFFNRTQSRVVIGLLTGHNTLRRHLYIMGLSNNLTCRKCGTGRKPQNHILCECEALASLRHTHLASFFLDPEDIRKLSIGAIWNFAKGTWLLWFSTEYGAQRACPKAKVHRARKDSNPNTIQFIYNLGPLSALYGSQCLGWNQSRSYSADSSNSAVAAIAVVELVIVMPRSQVVWFKPYGVLRC